MDLHGHASTYVRTHTQTCTHVETGTREYINTNTRTYTHRLHLHFHARTLAGLHSCMQNHTHTRRHSVTPTFIHVHSHARTLAIGTLAYMHSAHTCTRAKTLMLIRKHEHTHISKIAVNRTHTYISHACTLTSTYACVHAPSHAHALAFTQAVACTLTDHEFAYSHALALTSSRETPFWVKCTCLSCILKSYWINERSISLILIPTKHFECL